MGKTNGGPSVQVQQVEVTLSNDKGESQREDASLRVKDLKRNSLYKTQTEFHMISQTAQFTSQVTSMQNQRKTNRGAFDTSKVSLICKTCPHWCRILHFVPLNITFHAKVGNGYFQKG